MNIAVIVGEILNNATCRGSKTKALLFTVVTKNGGTDGEKELTSFVPCVVFNPPADLERRLTSGGKGLLIELQGRVNCSRPEGELKYNAEVIVYTKSITLR
jgi:hypothetical protein